MNYSGLNCRTRFVFISLLFAALFSTITAAPWEVDPTFANNGIYTFPTGQANSSIRSMVVLPDDRVIMAGYSSDGPLRNSRFPTLERLLPNGMPDPSFGVGGIIVFPFTGEFESVTLQPDGKILVAGSAFGRGDRSSRYILARFNADGSFDTSFAGTGLIIGPFDRSARFTQGDEVLLRDGTTDPTVFQPSEGNWYWFTIPDGQYHSAHFGANGDIPVTGDFDGDGNTDLSVFRPSTSYWIRLNSSNGQYFAQKFGTTGDIPVAGDYDGDGKYDLAVYRPSNGVWYLLNSSTGLTATQFGTAGDRPVPSVFLP